MRTGKTEFHSVPGFGEKELQAIEWVWPELKKQGKKSVTLVWERRSELDEA